MTDQRNLRPASVRLLAERDWRPLHGRRSWCPYVTREEDLAELLGCSRTAVSQRFNGQVAWTLDELELVADALGVKPGYFLEEPVEAAWRAAGR